jgi:hypothetical protein
MLPREPAQFQNPERLQERLGRPSPSRVSLDSASIHLLNEEKSQGASFRIILPQDELLPTDLFSRK